MTGPLVGEVRARAYRIPTPAPEADATLSWDHTTMVAVWVHAGGVTGLGWTYAHEACVPLAEGPLARAILGRPVLDVPGRWEAMRSAVRNLGRPGLVSCALSAVDIALWDAAARLLDLGVSRLLGRVHDEVAVYGSGGFVSQHLHELHSQLEDWTGRGIPRVKIKIGEDAGHRLDRDLARVRAARDVIGPGTELYVDANGGYTRGQARRVAPALEELGVSWFEEPVSSDDLDGLAALRDEISADVTAGEYGYDLAYFARMVPAVDCLQIDVTRCGGYTEWRRIAAVAQAGGLDVSAHCAPALSAHAGVATANIRHLEWFADHERIESAFVDGALAPEGGRARPDPSAPGHGFTLKEADLEPYAVGATVGSAS
ncbi:enolase C-terminal domain-like protein [Amycolatopsis thermophila]|uniref:L-alanine-DL-glutamate epimerase-like enolase superfamily enzyme n=1 Tax=Amycolatopsis thermophila TaxID=206084 RepID=A0ABU0F0X7_9PSEU|nr:enolase C-terminal domain-like protein [Amycolatopsis thermophila]MDQ0381229.1 L-alanine-DL-glutamate epimerase-like enolase superfamily enzyme [Amycolatopsis thermophila]